MKEAALVGLLAGLLTTGAFFVGLEVGKGDGYVMTCNEGQLYIGAGPVDSMLVAEVVYPLDKVKCNES